MDLVDDEDLVAVADRRDRQPLDDHLAHVVDAGVRRRVDFKDVDVPAFGDLDARIAHAARLGRGPLHAAQRARQDARRRGLAAAPRPRKHERLRDALALQRVLQRARDRVLAENVFEFLRAPLPRQHLVCH